MLLPSGIPKPTLQVLGGNLLRNGHPQTALWMPLVHAVRYSQCMHLRLRDLLYKGKQQ